jgi:A/G-specific adenine glycosylase
MMELGATICLPKNPLCGECPLSAGCGALAAGTAAQLPVKLRRVEAVKIDGAILIVRRNRRLLLRQREPDARRMAGFWDLPTPADLPDARVGRRIGEIRHTITRHHYTLAVSAAQSKVPAGPFRWFEISDIAGVPLSTTARKALQLEAKTLANLNE